MIDYKKEKSICKVLIDAGGLVYSATLGNKALDENNNPIKVNNKFVYKEKTVEEVCYHADNILLQLFTTLSCTHYIGFVDTEFRNSFRRKINPLYKANRDNKPVPKFTKEAKQHLMQEWGFIPSGGYIEADDLVSIHANHYKDEPIILYSNDKDVYNLPYLTYDGKNCTIYQNNEEHYKNFFWGQMIMGDSADNISGIRGKGKKYVQELFEKNPEASLESLVFNEFIKFYGEFKGVQEFYKTYSSLHTIRNFDELPDSEVTKKIQEWNRVPGTF